MESCNDLKLANTLFNNKIDSVSKGTVKSKKVNTSTFIYDSSIQDLDDFSLV